MSSMNSSATRNRHTRSRVYCHCHLNCELFTCRRGPNSGRKFYRCINNRTDDDCRYFKWIDEVEEASYGTYDEYEGFEVKIFKKLEWIIFLIKVFIATVLLDITIHLCFDKLSRGSKRQQRYLTWVKQIGKERQLAWKSSSGGIQAGKNRDDTCKQSTNNTPLIYILLSLWDMTRQAFMIKGHELTFIIDEVALITDLPNAENPNSFCFLLKLAENLTSFRFLLKQAENLDLFADDPSHRATKG
ncbi:hypothetical protein IEQ34_001166 [Dendrobium chrysotoxum]|uniref:GRF-type domain-containing protein n=1 Tax=Dendrobium chrysotoxum TaxID=161865 RepID=A0AAV7HQ12_DENCH|nr:hypothetical protein IEQ34_001166 [Dendrobium chrysotoxum]